MPDQLTRTTSAEVVEVHPKGRAVPVLQALAVVGIFVLSGALGGVLWYQLWSPPAGVVADGAWYTDENGLRGAFSGTGLYLLVAVLGGFLVGALVAFVLDRSELVTLAAMVVGASLGGWIMLRLGLEWSPADPQVLARSAEDGTPLPGKLSVDVPHPWLALPGGALVGMALVFLTTTKRVPRR